MFTEGIFPIGDGLLDINEDRLKELLVADDINEIYELEQTPFARGKFAAVRRAIHKNSGTHFAAKFLKRRRRAQSSDKEIKHEIAVLMLCDGADNIVKLNAVHESRSDTALLLELATGGELQTFLDNEECLSEAHARYCMREVLKALQYLHKRSIAHLDLKPQNILLTGERIEDGLKLCDFGISRVVAEGTNVREIVGTPDYVAPEVLQYEPLSLLTDIWSVGVLAYVLLSGFSPFGGETKQETFLNISQCALTFPDKLFGGVSAAAIDFIRRALRIKPNDRMTAAGCLEHIWLKDECSIDRQILTDITKSTTVDSAAAADDEDDDDEEDVDVDEDDDDDEAEEEDDEVEANEAELENEMSHDDGDEDELNISIDTEQQLNGTNGSKMESSDAEELAEENATKKQPVITNGKTAYNKSNSNGYSTYNGRSASNSNYSNNTARHNGTHTTYTNGAGSAARYTNGVKASATTPTTTTTQRTTAVVTVPAVRATTIPLQYNGGYRQQQQQQQQLQRQQQLQVLARRHSSSDSNKENTFLATKKIAPSTANVGSVVKKPLTATATTTIMIAGSEMGDTTTTTGVATANVVATFTLPSGYNHNHSNHSNNSSMNGSNSNHSNNNANHEKYITTTTHCLFPDAPTTPKVIRKTPNTEASPTSVKALVKKFQLEGGNTSPTAFEKHATTHLKEAQATNQQTLHATTTTQMNGVSAGNNSSSKKSPITNGIAKKFDTTRKYGGEQHNGTAGSGSLSNGRRASEPATVTHVTTHIAHNRSGSGGIGVGSAAATSYKTTCVLCIGGGGSKAASSSSSSNGTSSNGCRHSTDAAGRYNKTSSISNNNGTATTKCCSSKMTNSNANATNTATVTATAIVNGSSNGSTAATTTTALLLGSSHHQQQQQQQQQQLHQHHMNGVHHHAHHHHHHHHHHMHAATKAATANNLSLDQGIIC